MRRWRTEHTRNVLNIKKVLRFLLSTGIRGYLIVKPEVPGINKSFYKDEGIAYRPDITIKMLCTKKSGRSFESLTWVGMTASNRDSQKNPPL